VPEQLRRLGRFGDELLGPPAFAPLQHAYPLARFGEPTGGDSTAETGSHDHRVIRAGHATSVYADFSYATFGRGTKRTPRFLTSQVLVFRIFHVLSRWKHTVLFFVL
jgi:hypothetical protein